MKPLYKSSFCTPLRQLIEEAVDLWYDARKAYTLDKWETTQPICYSDLSDIQKGQILAAYLSEADDDYRVDISIDALVYSQEVTGVIIKAANEINFATQNQYLLQVGQTAMDCLFKRIEKQITQMLEDECQAYAHRSYPHVPANHEMNLINSEGL